MFSHTKKDDNSGSVIHPILGTLAFHGTYIIWPQGADLPWFDHQLFLYLQPLSLQQTHPSFLPSELLKIAVHQIQLMLNLHAGTHAFKSILNAANLFK